MELAARGAEALEDGNKSAPMQTDVVVTEFHSITSLYLPGGELVKFEITGEAVPESVQVCHPEGTVVHLEVLSEPQLTGDKIANGGGAAHRAEIERLESKNEQLEAQLLDLTEKLRDATAHNTELERKREELAASVVLHEEQLLTAEMHTKCTRSKESNIRVANISSESAAKLEEAVAAVRAEEAAEHARVLGDMEAKMAETASEHEKTVVELHRNLASAIARADDERASARALIGKCLAEKDSVAEELRQKLSASRGALVSASHALDCALAARSEPQAKLDNVDATHLEHADRRVAGDLENFASEAMARNEQTKRSRRAIFLNQPSPMPGAGARRGSVMLDSALLSGNGHLVADPLGSIVEDAAM
eukprot:SAG11_NODE_1535_length_4727_cov_4.389369_4_plen_366_part_00